MEYILTDADHSVKDSFIDNDSQLHYSAKGSQNATNSGLERNNSTDTLALALGYANEDIFYRAIATGKAPRKLKNSTPAELQQLSDNGYNLYFVVNGGGDTDAQVTQGRAIFYEHDDLDKSLQRNLWQSLGLPEPTIQVDTGGKSIHSYWVFEQPIGVDEWKRLQADLLEFADADRTIKNPSRIMRLPGYRHQKTGELSTIVTNSGQRYSYNDLRAIIPTPQTELPIDKPKKANKTEYTPSYGGELSLIDCIAVAHRNLIKHGAGEGERNNSGAKLARDLIGTENYLQNLKISFDGDARDLFDDFCLACDPEIDAAEADTIWRSAQNDHPSPCLSPDKLIACIAAKQRQNADQTALEIPDELDPYQVKLFPIVGDDDAHVQRLYQLVPKNQKLVRVLEPESILADVLSVYWANSLMFDTISESFWEYGAEVAGKWSVLPDTTAKKRIADELRKTLVGHSNKTVSSVCELLKIGLSRKMPTSPRHIIPMRNGVLDTRTMQLSAHSESHYFTWQLPYHYTPGADCPKIRAWLDFTQYGHSDRVNLLRAYLKAVVTGRSDLQRFVSLIGAGGSGKSTFANCAIALVGAENCQASKLSYLGSHKFETAGFYGKRLVYFTDAERFSGGGTDTFKALTGGDPIRHEAKFKNSTSFVYGGMVLLVGNSMIQWGDDSSGMARREVVIPFRRQVPASQQRTLIEFRDGEMFGDFVDELPGLFNWVMAMSDDDVRRYIKITDESVTSLNEDRTENLIQTNAMAAWLDECCIFLDGARTAIGKTIEIRQSTTTMEMGQTVSRTRVLYENQDDWLYPNYVAFCKANNQHPVSFRRFWECLDDLCRVQLGYTVDRIYPKNRATVVGIAIRHESHTEIPSPITKRLVNAPEWDSPEAETVGDVMAEIHYEDGAVEVIEHESLPNMPF